MIPASAPRVQAEIIVALDEPSRDDALRLADRLGARGSFYKVGLQLFIAAGPPIIADLRARGARVFLDLKLHDIPNTVASAVRAACESDVDLCTIHLGGGPEMCAAAVEAAGARTRVLGVTVLTSSDEATLRACGVGGEVAGQVLRLARMGFDAGVRGFVASALELPMLRRALGRDPLMVIPGVRPAGADLGDQKRVATPSEVVRAGATHLVVGRPISRAADPAAAYDAIEAEIAGLVRPG